MLKNLVTFRSASWVLTGILFVILVWWDGRLDTGDLRRTMIVATLLIAWWWYVRRRPVGPIRLEGEFIVWKEVAGTARRVDLGEIRRVVVQQEIENAISGQTRLDLKLFTAQEVHKVPIHHRKDFGVFLDELESRLASRDVNVLHVDLRGRIAKSSREELRRTFRR